MEGYDKNDVLGYVKENGVRFVRLAFCDIFGQLKNVSISASMLEKAFEEGVKTGIRLMMEVGTLFDNDFKDANETELCLLL